MSPCPFIISSPTIAVHIYDAFFACMCSDIRDFAYKSRPIQFRFNLTRFPLSEHKKIKLCLNNTRLPLEYRGYFIEFSTTCSENQKTHNVNTSWSLLRIPSRTESNCKSLACNGSEAKAIVVYRLPWVYSHH